MLGHDIKKIGGEDLAVYGRPCIHGIPIYGYLTPGAGNLQ